MCWLVCWLVSNYTLNNPKLEPCCKTVEPDEADDDSDSDDTVETVWSDNLNKVSGNTTATLPIPHPFRTHHYDYDPHCQIYACKPCREESMTQTPRQFDEAGNKTNA